MKTILFVLSLLVTILHAEISPPQAAANHFAAMNKITAKNSTSPEKNLDQLIAYLAKNQQDINKNIQLTAQNLTDNKISEIETKETISKSLFPLYKSFNDLFTSLQKSENQPALQKLSTLQLAISKTLSPLDEAFAKSAPIPDTPQFKIITKHFNEITKIAKENQNDPKASIQKIQSYYKQNQPELIDQATAIAKDLKATQPAEKASSKAQITKNALDAITFDFKGQMAEIGQKLEKLPKAKTAHDAMSSFRAAYRNTFLPVSIAIKKATIQNPSPRPEPSPLPPNATPPNK